MGAARIGGGAQIKLVKHKHQTIIVYTILGFYCSARQSLFIYQQK